MKHLLFPQSRIHSCSVEAAERDSTSEFRSRGGCIGSIPQAPAAADRYRAAFVKKLSRDNDHNAIPVLIQQKDMR
jgi:hypothetical protein